MWAVILLVAVLGGTAMHMNKVNHDLVSQNDQMHKYIKKRSINKNTKHTSNPDIEIANLGN